MKLEAWSDLDEWDVKNFGRHANMRLEELNRGVEELDIPIAYHTNIVGFASHCGGLCLGVKGTILVCDVSMRRK